jgi:hypothetical protein
MTDTRPTGAAPNGAHANDATTPGLAPQYPNVEAWVRDYFLPSFPRPAGELGAAGRWRWCEQWWRHDEAVTILTALWYGWEHAAVQTLGMLDWLPRLYYLLPILTGDDGPFRLCAPTTGDLPARHDTPTIADITPAPAGWWHWWGTDATTLTADREAEGC